MNALFVMSHIALCGLDSQDEAPHRAKKFPKKIVRAPSCSFDACGKYQRFHWHLNITLVAYGAPQASQRSVAGPVAIYRDMEEADSKLHALLEEAEAHLVKHRYLAAEAASHRALQAACSLPEPSERLRLGDRAAVVLVQAQFETSRFCSARRCLCDAFGSLEDAPPTAVLLWLSLALDTEERQHAHTLILRLLQTKARCQQWRRRQYIALLHLYLLEVLLPALRDPSEVRLWLQRQHFLPLDPRERQVGAAALGALFFFLNYRRAVFANLQ